MKTTLMTKMMVFGFALTIGLILGLSSAGAQPSFNILECICEIDEENCSCDPGCLTWCRINFENTGNEQFDGLAVLDLNNGEHGASIHHPVVPPGESVHLSIGWLKESGVYPYLWTITATDDAGNVTTDSCDGTVIVCPIQVPIDIKPMSCPNPLNVKDRGVLSVAILGTDNLDVTQIDPASIELAGVSPLRWSWEDVATPAEDGCNEYEGDGYLDLVLKFDTQEVIANLGEVEDGQEIPLSLTGNLMEEYGSTPIMGEDVVVIVKKGN